MSGDELRRNPVDAVPDVMRAMTLQSRVGGDNGLGSRVPLPERYYKNLCTGQRISNPVPRP